MTRIVVLQNVQCESLGVIGQVLSGYGLEPEYVRTFDRQPVPRHLRSITGLIVLGGPMSVYEINRYPFLADTLRLIDQALKRDVPVLGVGLGSQLLATRLGATVRQGERKEIGWHSVELTGDARRDLLFSGASQTFTAYHWHGDVFDVPSGATLLARSGMAPCQAFVHGLTAYGVLFHMEVTEKIVRDMVNTFTADLKHEGLEGNGIVEKLPRHIHLLQSIGRSVFQNWVELCLESEHG